MPADDVTTQTIPSPALPAKKTAPQTNTQPKVLPPHAVVLHNDPINEMDFVVGVLKKVFHYGTGRAFLMMIRAHLTGRSIIWTGSLEVAELKAEQVHACGPDPRKRAKGAQPLKTTVEPLPG
jgi:ATP-dependent Clp protease adaptor protein ClpS